MKTANVNLSEKKNLSPAEELHRISEQFDELIQIIRNSTFEKNGKNG